MVKIYCVRDQFLGYGQLFTAANDAVAIRDFRHALSQKDSLMYFSAKDYDLMCLGTFDPDLGVISSEAPVILASGASIVKEVENNA